MAKAEHHYGIHAITALLESQPEQVLGLTRDQLCGRTSVDERWRTVHDDLSPYTGDRHPIARSLRDGVSVRGDSMGVVTPEGEQRWLLVNSEPLRSPAGDVTGAVACFVDVTEQRAQRTLLQLALRAAAIEAAEVVFRVCHQLHGAAGFCDETTLSWLSRYSQPLRRLPLGLSATRDLLAARIGRRGLTGLYTP